MKISVITINFNNAFGLKNTIESVFSQSFTEFEYIIIDGGSTDGSVEIIKLNSSKFSYWISEPDRGIYNAMNKGIKAAKGEFLLFLNSGDYLFDKDVLEKLLNFENRQYDLIYGNLNIVESDKSWIKYYPSELRFSYFVKDTLPHPATLIKRNLFEQISPYNELNKIVSDWEFFLLAINKYNCTYKYMPFIVTNFMYDGISSKQENLEFLMDERRRVLETHFPSYLKDYIELDKLHKEILLLRKSRVFKLSQKFKKLL